MDENNVVDLEQSAETGVFDTEFEQINTEYSENNVVDGSNIVNSDSDISVMDETTSDIESAAVPETTSVSESSGTAALSVETYYNSELGGYPVVIIQDLSGDYGTSLMADYEDYYTTLSTTWEDYFAGVLANIGDTEYMAYCLRDYVSNSYSSYTDHYVLYYDLQIENDALVGGSYPYIDVYRDGSYGYVCNEGNGTLTSVPFPAYGSFGKLSDIREGVTHNEMYAVLFAIGFAVCYGVCTRIFDYVRTLRRGSKG